MAHCCKTLEIRRDGAVVPFNGPLSPTEKKNRAAAWLFWKGKCAFCGRRATESHHAGYRHDGFSFSFDIQPVCRSCHIRQHGYQKYANDNQLDFWLKKTG